MTWTLPEPMLAAPVSDPVLLPGWAGEPKWDGFRALLSVDAGRVVLRSRRGTEMAASFPEVVDGAVHLPDATALDGELVVWDAAGSLAFERLQNRLARRGAGAALAAQEWPAHFVAFDLVRLSGTDTTGWPYRRRRAALESVFAARQLIAPWALCPSTTDPDTVREWLTWTSVGIEGVVFKRLDGRYEASVRGWLKYKVRETQEAIVGAVTGSLAAPRTLLLGRYDTTGRLRYTGRTTTLPQAAGRALAGLLAPAGNGHPWTGWTFSAGWGTREALAVTLVRPELVAEVGADIARDSAGRWRHPARWHRARPDVDALEVPLFREESSGTPP
ncbi:ATP-dependent DNA ligase [Streptomyces turgidiscabies]|uniref:ATP-dependent DNA ligase n=1 Tax=Streptomyces turgidiscabies TaxID=85558 RepID=A0ABU0RTI9_9ACTN|nr:ATP-dependent DNA ligase [Streptomyces turgidiscabies]MDQ0935103.1 ATP-dependent DNA ligase [Streptomyces turgidiscabies]